MKMERILPQKKMEKMIQKAAEEAETTFEKIKVKYSCFTHIFFAFDLEMANNFEDAQNVPDVTDPKDFIG